MIIWAFLAPEKRFISNNQVREENVAANWGHMERGKSDRTAIPS